MLKSMSTHTVLEIIMARARSPNYPVITLESALSYIDRLNAFTRGRHFVPVGSALVDAWGMKPGSAYGLQVVAALKSFGLVDEIGSKGARQIRISEVASKIHGEHSDRPRLLREAALTPPLHRELWDRFASEDGLPPAPTLCQYLRFDRDGARFIESTVQGFVDQFLATVEFAGLRKSDTMDDGTTSEIDANGDGGGPEEVPRNEKPPQVPKARQMLPGIKEDVFSLDEGSVVLQWPERLSKASAEDLQDWLELIGRKIKRAAAAPPEDKHRDEGDG